MSCFADSVAFVKGERFFRIDFPFGMIWVGVVDDAIEHGGAHRGTYDVGVPVLHRQLPGDDGLRVEDLGFRLVGSRSAPGWFKACGRRNDARRVPEAPVPR